MNIDNLLIEENDIEIAQNICKTIDEAQTRNRAVSNVLASKIASRFFEGEGLDLDINSGLHNVGKVLEDIDIADVYLKGSYIDIRTYFDDDKIFVPKAHFDNNLLPVAYMFIKISSDLSGASVGGFILPENIDTQSEINGFYKIDEDSLVSYYDIEPNIITVEDNYSVEEELIYSYLDNKIENKSEFYSELIKSKDARMKLMSFARAQYVFNFVSVADDVEESSTDNSDSFELEIADDNFLLEEDNVLDLNSDNTDILQEDLSGDDLEVFDELNSFDNLVEAEEIESNEEIEADDNLLESLNSEDEIIENNIESFESDNNDNEDENIVSELFTDTSGFDFETTVTPSMQESEEENVEEVVEEAAEENVIENELDVEDLDETPDIPLEFSEDELVEDNSTIEDVENTDTQEQIDALFEPEEVNSEETETIESTEDTVDVKKSTMKPLLVLLMLLLIGGAGYFGYNKFMAPSSVEDTQVMPDDGVNQNNVAENKQQEDVMPIETVETQPAKVAQNEGNSVSIPAIEQNLDASIIVSNLSVAWEVPSGYASNTSASRFLTKLGKIIQLNLKTELLLLSKPPITNKISVEIKFNNSTKKFETVGIVASSGEKSVDDLILQTVNRVLDMNLNINTDSFSKLQGNPVLIIKL